MWYNNNNNNNKKKKKKKKKKKRTLKYGGQVEIIQTTTYWERPEYWEESLRLEETCCRSNSCERPSADAVMWKTRKEYRNDNNNYNNMMLLRGNVFPILFEKQISFVLLCIRGQCASISQKKWYEIDRI